jgi:hypothetical protein
MIKSGNIIDYNTNFSKLQVGDFFFYDGLLWRKNRKESAESFGENGAGFCNFATGADGVGDYNVIKISTNAIAKFVENAIDCKNTIFLKKDMIDSLIGLIDSEYEAVGEHSDSIGTTTAKNRKDHLNSIKEALTGEPCTDLTMAKKMWKSFGEAVVDDDDCLVYEWERFPIGTDKFEVWKWIEKTYNVSIIKDLEPSWGK